MSKQNSWKRLFIGGVAATAVVASVAAVTPGDRIFVMQIDDHIRAEFLRSFQPDRLQMPAKMDDNSSLALYST